MQKKATLKYVCSYSLFIPLLILGLTLVTNKTVAQNSFCANETSLWLETFGTGTTPTSNPDIDPAVLTYQDTGSLKNEGVYRVINNTQQKPEWQASPDHTGDLNGKMLVVNGNGSTFYTHELNSASGFLPGDYGASLFVMNLNTIPTCGSNALLPVISFEVEYQAADNSWVPLMGSPVTAPPVVKTATPTWVKLGGVFALPATGTFIVKNIRITLTDGIRGGCGNDYALDDIKFSTCPAGGPLPVQFLSISAKQKGSRVSVTWSTASEINNKYYDVEKSIDGGANWVLVSTVKGSGNSSTKKSYEATDIRPTPGYNYYRIKQVDIDGQYKYSATANVKMLIEKSSAFVLANPFKDRITIEFLSKSNQAVNVSLYDVAGKRVAAERMVIPQGSTRQTLDNIGSIQKGMYILNIKDENGEVLYNGKLIKQ